MKKTALPGLKSELSVGDVARRSGVAISAIHFYETKGLVTSWRNAGNQRRYPREALRRVSIVKVAQRVGIPLVSIKAALDSLPKGRTPTDQDWRKLSSPLARRARRPHRQAQPLARPADGLHRLRLPLHALLPAPKPEG